MTDDTAIESVKYIGSFPSESKCPGSERPEYAFIGRSNVGKSSLINMLMGRRDLAHVSKSPGKTKSINLFVVEDSWQLADLPGYGYAKVSKTERKRWQKMIEDYMRLRPNMVTAFVLLDLRHPLQAIDKEFIDWMGQSQVPFAIVYTKADKLKPREVSSHQKQIGDALLETWDEIPSAFVTSSTKRQGRGALLQYIAELNEGISRD